MPEVRFTYHTGINQELFRNVRLTGNWTEDGHQTDSWRILPMEAFRDETGCFAYKAAAPFAPEETGKSFS